MSLPLTAFLICKDFIVDNSGALSILTIIEGLGVKDFPSQVNICLYLCVRQLTGKHAIWITLNPPGAQELVVALWDPFEAKRTGSISHFLNRTELKLGQPGAYIFRAYLDGAAIGQIDLPIQRAEDQAQSEDVDTVGPAKSVRKQESGAG